MTCAECGAVVPDGAKFCFNCGARLEAPRPPEGERRFVTVLFADVVDSTAMGDVVDPETIAEIMNGAFSFFNASVARFGGTVARLMGDAVLAIFGAPVAHEDDAERAVHAGLAILSAAEQYAQAVKRRYGIEFRVRVGINSGLAVLAMVGDDVKMEYTAMGDTANLASRLQNLADPGTLLVSTETHSLVRKLFESRSLGRVQVKGKAEPVEIFQVTGITAKPGSVRGLDGLQSPLVGRDDEVARARDAIAGRRHAGGIIIVSGEAGLGKSRMVAELRGWVSQIPDAPLWLEGRALSYGQTIAYYPWRQIVRGAIGVEEGTSPAEIRERVETAVPAEDVAPLERLLAVDDEATAEDVEGLSGEALVLRITDAVARLLTSAREGGVVAVLDDLHWADEASLDLLRAIADLTADRALVVLAMTRPDRDAHSARTLDQIRERCGERVTQIDLEPLDDDASERLLSNLLQVRDLPDDVRKEILDKSDGNPFFIEEVIRWLIDSGHIVQDGDNWRAAREIATVAVPETLAGVLASRIDRLPPETKRVVQAAAVIGRIFQYPVLKRVAEQDRIANPEPHVRELTAEELIREKNPLLDYIFKHALTQEAAKDLLLLRRRREYHELVGKTLEDLYPDRLDELAAMLAYHFREAESWERAAQYARRAAVNEVGLAAIREAVQHFDDEYTALSRLDSASPEKVIDAVTNWVQIGWKELVIHQKNYSLVIERLEHAERLARELDDKQRLAAVLNWKGNVHMSAGFPSRGMQGIFEAFDLIKGSNDPLLLILPLFMQTSFKVDTNPREAIPAFEELYEMAMQGGRSDIAAHGLSKKALAHARIGEFADAEKTLARALKLAEYTDVPVKKADVHLVAALVNLDMGRIESALDFARRGADEAAGAGAGECAIYGMYCLGQSVLRARNLGEARSTFNRGLQRTESVRSETLASLNRAGLALTESESDGEEATAQLERALAQASARRDVYTEAQVAQSLAQLLLGKGDLQRAEESLTIALAYYRRNGMLPYLVRAVTVAAQLYEKQGRAADAAAANAELAELQERYDRALLQRDEVLVQV
jgi:class 3 adenylate cyclase/tetratricopeptide (TPR) repeat protein